MSYSNSDVNISQIKIQHDFHLLILWFSYNRLSSNESKTKSLPFPFKININSKYPLSIIQEAVARLVVVTQSKCTKYHGLHWGAKLMFHQHISPLKSICFYF